MADASSHTTDKAMSLRGIARISVMQGDFKSGLEKMLSALVLLPNSPLIHEDLATYLRRFKRVFNRFRTFINSSKTWACSRHEYAFGIKKIS